MAGLPDRLGGEEAVFEGSIPPFAGNDVPSLVPSCEDIRALDPRENCTEHDVDEVIASLESQVDHLCSLLDNFRSEFQTKLYDFREYIRNLPDHVGVAYSPRQRAYLLKMYGKSIVESGELALQKLQHNLEHLISLEGDARPYEEYCSVESSFVSCKSEMESTDTLPEQNPDRKVRLRPFASLLRSVKWPMPTPTSSFVSDLSVAEAALDEGDDNTTSGEAQQLPAVKPEGVALRPHREVIIDWERFCGDCPARASPPYCKGCSGWRRGFEDPTWDGVESRRGSVDANVSVEDFAW